jgi:hypothetical protein
MRTYKLIANNEQGASAEFTGNSLTSVKNQFKRAYDVRDFTARIYDNGNGAFVQFKPMGGKTFKNPVSK